MAQSVIQANVDRVYFEMYKKPNISCNANTTVQVDFSISVPNGMCATVVMAWVDATDTTSATGMANMFLLNIWGHMAKTGTATPYMLFRNIANASAKFTANILVCFTPDRYIV